MLDYELMINDKKFSGEIDYEIQSDSDNSIQLEMLLKAAPVYYLYKFKDSENLVKFITPYTALSLIGVTGLNDLIEFNNSEIKIDYFGEESKDSILLQFIRLCVNEIIETDSFDGEQFLKQVNDLNLNQFQNKRRIYNYINEIIGACYNLKNKKKKAKTFERYISDKLLSLLKVISPKVYDFIRKYQNIEYRDNSFYLSCLFSKNINNKQAMSATISNNIKSLLNFLSVTPFSNTQYLNKLKSMKNLFIKQLPKFMEDHDRCFAIAHNKKSIYFSFSGLWDIDGKMKNGIEKLAQKINTDLFQDKATWCKLTKNVLNYVDINSPDNQDECIYIDPPEQFPGKRADFFSCCERKILGKQQDLTKYDLYVMFSPCYRCAKPLYKNYSNITCLIDFNDKDKSVNYKDNLFNPKKYEVVKIHDHYKVRKIGK